MNRTDRLYALVRPGEHASEVVRRALEGLERVTEARQDWQRATHAEATRVYQADIKPILDTLEDLLHRDRWHISATGLADHAVMLKRGMARLLSLFDAHRQG